VRAELSVRSGEVNLRIRESASAAK
jgi:hypothetical protein